MRDPLNIEEFSAIAFIRPLADHVNQHGLSRRKVERIYHAQKRGQQENLPYLHLPCESQCGENEREDHRGRLGCDYHVLPTVAIRSSPTEGSHQKHWNLCGESHGTQQKARDGQPIHQPRLGNDLHPGANQ